MDVQHYRFEITLNDENNEIKGKAIIQIKFKKDVTHVYLDLASRVNGIGDGMKITGIAGPHDQGLHYTHEDDVLSLLFSAKQGETHELKVEYQGVPKNGLIIAENKFGERTFFGDNWPDRGKHYLPTVDHPSDKATVDWVITAPEHYQVIGNGRLIETTNLEGGMKITRWRTDVPIPTKVMVFGAARFAVEYLGRTYGTEVSSWVYPQDRDAGFYDYAIAPEILDWFINHVGPYPFSKLANVQSKTMFGGMENAGNIFYSERSVTGERRSAGTVVHEIAHQWFGNSASEADWHHAWLSEGFATYFTNLYYEQKEGRDNFVNRLKTQRFRVIQFSKSKPVPIVDTSIIDYMQALNANTYQKGGWVLHMLRREVGDEHFWEGIRAYYKKYTLSNALSEDLRDVFEEVSGQELDGFFRQWLYQPGQPQLDAKWHYNEGKLEVQINQTQIEDFEFDLDIEVIYEDGTSEKHTVPITSKTQVWSPEVKSKPLDVKLDPDTWLLFEGKIERK